MLGFIFGIIRVFSTITLLFFTLVGNLAVILHPHCLFQADSCSQAQKSNIPMFFFIFTLPTIIFGLWMWFQSRDAEPLEGGVAEKLHNALKDRK